MHGGSSCYNARVKNGLARGVANTAFGAWWTAWMVSVCAAHAAAVRDRATFVRLQRVWAAGLARVWGMEVTTFGADRMDPAQTYVVMSNHQSHVDIPTLLVALPVVPGFLAKKELRRVPFLGLALELGGHVLIDRTRRVDAFRALEEAAKQVRAGSTLVVFPEGTRSASPTLCSFKKGGFHLAKQAGVPIVPVGIRGTRAILPKHGRLVRPGPVEVHIGTPIGADEIAQLALPRLMERVRKEIALLGDYAS